jgi:hypothetical protein
MRTLRRALLSLARQFDLAVNLKVVGEEKNVTGDGKVLLHERYELAGYAVK